MKLKNYVKINKIKEVRILKAFLRFMRKNG